MDKEPPPVITAPIVALGGPRFPAQGPMPNTALCDTEFSTHKVRDVH